MNLPPWAPTLYPKQEKAIEEITTAFQSGKRVVMLDAPTGSGKTLIGYLVAQSLGARSIYACSSISLQEQFLRDFPQAALLKGRSNYPTLDNPDSPITAGDCVKSREMVPACNDCPQLPEGTKPYLDMHCRWCHPVPVCPYELAKQQAITNPLVCTNIHYFLYESNYQGYLKVNRHLVIIDEADTLEDVLLGFIEVHIPAKRAQQFAIQPPAKKTVESAWVTWAQDSLDKIKQLCNNEGPVSRKDDVATIRRKHYLQSLVEDLKRLNDPVSGIASGGWVYTGYADDSGSITFRPIRVDSYGEAYIWRHAPRFLLMSATTISFPSLADCLGIQ